MVRTDSPRSFARLIAITLLALLALPVAGHAGTGYTAHDGKLYDAAGQQVQVRGINHFGFNAEILQPQYLWSMGWKEQIAQIKRLGFNAVRVPFVPETLYSDQPVDVLSYIDPGKNPELLGKTPLEVLDLWMEEANRQGLYIMLDFHSVSKKRLYPTWFVDDPADYALTYNGKAYSEDDWIRDLEFVAERYADLPYFFAIDIYNEPNGIVRWSSGDPNVTDPKYYWKRAAEKAAAAVLQRNPELLVFVQGINGNFDGIEDSDIPMNWGESFQQQAYQPLDIPLDKLVLSPHTYGPDVYHKSTFDHPDYPDNLAQDWETLFGQFSPTHPVIISEWGGRYGEGGVGEADVIWQNALVDYLADKGIHSSFYWSYTPNSGDTGGILDDSLNVREDKMELLRRHWGETTTEPASEPESDPEPATEPAPEPAPSDFAASFDLSPNVNEWWVEVWIEANSALSAVDVRIDGGAWTSLVGNEWGSWARSLNVPTGSEVMFRATAEDGSTATSGTYRWLESETATEPEPGPETVTETVTETEPDITAPYIQDFAPKSGAVGTVVTFTGSGFTGLDNAWVGEAREATVSVVSDSEAQVVIPPDATTGSIGLFNSGGVSFSASSFTVLD